MRRYPSQPVVAAAALVTAMSVSALTTQRPAPESAASRAPGGPTKERKAARKLSADEPLNLNAAEAADLELLPGIGPKLAKRIEEYRAHHGPFKTADQLIEVPGIGEKKLQKIRHYVTTDPTSRGQTRTQTSPSP